MEIFKICEKEAKTKAFSKEGLGQQPKTDPKEKAKSETRDWINNVVGELETQINIFEAEMEGLSVKKGKTRPPRLTHLETSITRHEAHIMKLELILRLLDNDESSPEQPCRLLLAPSSYQQVTSVPEPAEESSPRYANANLLSEASGVPTASSIVPGPTSVLGVPESTAVATSPSTVVSSVSVFLAVDHLLLSVLLPCQAGESRKAAARKNPSIALSDTSDEEADDTGSDDAYDISTEKPPAKAGRKPRAAAAVSKKRGPAKKANAKQMALNDMLKLAESTGISPEKKVGRLPWTRRANSVLQTQRSSDTTTLR
ncbi:hypothetical protein MLD38_033259 [Melastoma candidum]|uniref:Uncharacterized protein n=1 Tax=Melastoma candidum TaxID=119954 RepID=A0ACB9M6M9_9MYRT|nr:hypothetical protein MLD38_033259 [Melastoma candidum]